MKTSAKLIKTNGQLIAVQPRNGKHFALDEMQAFVGGYIELAYPPSIDSGAVIVANEEGVLENLPLNNLATKMLGQEIVGDVLLCRKEQLL